MPTNNNWMNTDALIVRFGRDEGLSTNGGDFADMDGKFHILEFNFSLATLDTLNTYILSETIKLPKDCHIMSATLDVETAFTSGGAMTVDVGLIKADRTTVLNATGIFAGVTVASLVAGANLVGAGALIDTNLATDQPLLVTIKASTAIATAGTGFIRIYYYQR
jgi:hypothetical protein